MRHARRPPTIEPLEGRRLLAVDLHVLATLGGSGDGRRAETGVAVDPGGAVYGTVHRADGTTDLFRVDAGATATVARFPADFAQDGTSGNGPVGRVVRDAAGDLFGLTSNDAGGGAVGVLWTLPSGGSAPAVLHRFDNPYDPASLSIDGAGNLYGSAQVIGGGGLVWWQYSADRPAFRQLTAAGDGNVSQTVVADAAGDLFGTAVTGFGGFHGFDVQYRSHLTEMSAAAVTAATAAPGRPGTPVGLTADAGGDPPFGLAVTAAGDVYASTASGVQVWRPGATSLRPVATVSATDRLQVASDPTVTAAGDVYVVANRTDGGSATPGVVLAVAAGSAGFTRAAELPAGANPFADTLVPDGAGNLYAVAGAEDQAIVYRLTGRPDPAGPPPAVVASTVPAAVIPAGGRGRAWSSCRSRTTRGRRSPGPSGSTCSPRRPG